MIKPTSGSCGGRIRTTRAALYGAQFCTPHHRLPQLKAFDEPNEYVIMKTPGVFSLHVVARYVFDVLRRRDIAEPTVDDFRDILKDLDEYATSNYWKGGNIEGAAMAGSMSGFKLLADTFTDALDEAGHQAD